MSSELEIPIPGDSYEDEMRSSRPSVSLSSTGQVLKKALQSSTCDLGGGGGLGVVVATVTKWHRNPQETSTWRLTVYEKEVTKQEEKLLNFG